MIAAPTASEMSMGTAWAMIVVTGRRLLLDIPRLKSPGPGDQPLQVVPVLHDDRQVEPVLLVDIGEQRRRHRPAGELPRRVDPGARVVQDEDQGDDHPQRDEPEDDAADQEAGHAGFAFFFCAPAKMRSVRGSSASRTASPRRLKASVVASRNSIGKM